MKKIDWVSIIASMSTSALFCGSVIGVMYNMASQPMRDRIELNKVSICLSEERCKDAIKQVDKERLINEERLETDIKENTRKIEAVSDWKVFAVKLQSDIQYLKVSISELKTDIKDSNRKRED